MNIIETFYNTFKGSGIGDIPYVTEIFTRIASLYYDRPIIIDGQKFRPSVACGFEGARDIRKKGVDEEHVSKLFCSLINENDIVMDIGASIGYYTILAAKRARKVYAFEPLPFAYKRLIENININHYNNVEAIQLGISDKSSIKTLHVPKVGITGSTYSKMVTSNRVIDVDIKTIPLDSLEVQPNLIKIDVEGAEVDVLKGMTNILNKGTTIICEVHKPLIEALGYKTIDIDTIMYKHGYNTYLIQEDGLHKVDKVDWGHYLFKK